MQRKFKVPLYACSNSGSDGRLDMIAVWWDKLGWDDCSCRLEDCIGRVDQEMKRKKVKMRWKNLKTGAGLWLMTSVGIIR